MFNISKEFACCYGHRVFVQKLNKDFCAKGDTSTKCRHIHGHEGKLVVHIEANSLDDRSMVVDFKELGWLKDFIDDNIDHKFIIAEHDPMFQKLVVDTYNSAPTIDNAAFEPVTKEMLLADIDGYSQMVYAGGTNLCVGKTLDLTYLQPGTPEYETLEGFFIVKFVPTSEELSRWLYQIVDVKMVQIGAKVSRVEWHETPKSCAVYKGWQ